MQGPEDAMPSSDLDDEEVEATQAFHKAGAGPTHSCKIRRSSKQRPGDKLHQPVMRLKSPRPAPWKGNPADESIWEPDDETTPAAGVADNKLDFSIQDAGL